MDRGHLCPQSVRSALGICSRFALMRAGMPALQSERIVRFRITVSPFFDSIETKMQCILRF